jgi:hypothetical protein
MSDQRRLIFNPPPGWPKPPQGWTPPNGWKPDPAWPKPPVGWQLWIPAGGDGDKPVSRLHGAGFALLGNAAEFLDPVFSSGVTIALKSAKLAADLLDQQFRGEPADWQTQFAEPLMYGVETFRSFVNGWYDGDLQDVIFFEHKDPVIRRMICSVLAGYAWDPKNPYTGPQAARRLRALADTVRAGTARALKS